MSRRPATAARPCRSTRLQRGVAVVTALVVVAAATVAVAAMLWRQSIAIRKVENQAALSQTRWLGRGAVDWARVILREDARLSQADHLGELWAVPLAETRVSPDGIAQGSADDPASATVSGRIVDAQGRYNLTNLLGAGGGAAVAANQAAVTSAAEAAAAALGANAPGAAAAGAGAEVANGPPVARDDQGRARPLQPPAAEVAALMRLLAALGQPPEEAQRDARVIAQRMNEVPRPVALDDFTGMIDARILDALREHAVILPRPTAVNVNTASAEVLAARYENLSLERARALVESRNKAYFNQVSDAANRLPGNPLTAPPNTVAINTQFFRVEGVVRQQRVELALRAAIERTSNGATRVFDFREL